MIKCKLCHTRKADQTNSHIVPKFLSKRLFENSAPRHTLTIDRTGRTTKLQDTPKEDYIFCKFCEKRFEILETYFARRIKELNEFQKHPNQFILRALDTQEYILWLNLDPKRFLLFIYMIVWRVSISSELVFANYKLKPDSEETIRSFIDTNLSISHKELLNNPIHVPETLNFTICVMKAKEHNEETRGMLIASHLSETTYLLFITEFVIILYFDPETTEIAHRVFALNNQIQLEIPVAQTKKWQGMLELIYDNLTSESNGT